MGQRLSDPCVYGVRMTRHISIDHCGPGCPGHQRRDGSRKDRLGFKRIAKADLLPWACGFLCGLLHNFVVARFFAYANEVAFALKKLAESAAQKFAFVRKVAIPHISFQRERKERAKTRFNLGGFSFLRNLGVVFFLCLHAFPLAPYTRKQAECQTNLQFGQDISCRQWRSMSDSG